jgi:LEA14-like dessication related protein
MISIIILLVSIIVFVNIQTIKAPDATITIEIIDVNSKEATVETIMDIYNPNDFDIISKNLKIITTTIEG